MHIRTKRKIIIGFLAFIALLVGIIVSVYLAQQTQDPRQRASELTPSPGDEELSSTPSATLIPSPACIPDQASCEWDLVQNATSYKVEVIETTPNSDEEPETIVNTTVQAPTSKMPFTIKPGMTYQCKVSAVNECGTGPAGEATNSCASIPTPSPTEITPSPTEKPSPTPTVPPPTPTNTPVPPLVTVVERQTQRVVQQQQTRTVTREVTRTVVQQATPIPTLPPTGPVEVVLGAGAAAVIGVIGAVIFFLL